MIVIALKLLGTAVLAGFFWAAIVTVGLLIGWVIL